MKKLVVALTLAAFMLAVAGVAIASNDGYHEVFKWNTTVWGPSATDEAEMYSANTHTQQFRFYSDPSHSVCSGDYLPPYPGSALVKTISNTVHYFPWVDLTVTEKDLTWDVFKPGAYLAKGPIIKLKANCPVVVSFGMKDVLVPVDFDPATQKIGFEVYPPTSHTDERLPVDDKGRIHSLLKDDYSPGTDPDVIEMYWWFKETATQPDEHYVTAAELAEVPVFGHADWYTAAELDNYYIGVPDSVQLHTEWCIVTFESIWIAPCVSEGKYFEEFTFLVFPRDP